MQGRARATKPKRCANCKQLYVPSPWAPPFAKWCSLDCGIELGRERAEKALLKRQAKELRERKVALKPRSKWLQEAQAAVNAYVRERDHGQPCISCQRHHEGQWHAGHYRSVGAMPSLRFNTWNIWRQCSACNAQLSGNLIEYRINLVKKAGSCRVDWLEKSHPVKKFDVIYLRRIKRVFAKKVRIITKIREKGAQ